MDAGGDDEEEMGMRKVDRERLGEGREVPSDPTSPVGLRRAGEVKSVREKRGLTRRREDAKEDGGRVKGFASRDCCGEGGEEGARMLVYGVLEELRVIKVLRRWSCCEYGAGKR